MRIPSNKISDVAGFFKQELTGIYPAEEIKELIFLSFECVLNFSKTNLSVKENETVSESELLKFNNIVKDLKKQKPIQYILGTTKFYGLDLIVNENVLIPRPETEELVDLIIKESEVRNRKSEVNILDIGTGSGCIAIALKKNIPNSTVYTIDISEKALTVAKRNAQKNKAVINFINADILTLKPLNPPDSFDIIVSNPPYISHSEKDKMQKNVLDYEPHQALFVDDADSLIFYDKIADFSVKHLANNGKLYLEINEKYGKEVVALLLQKGLKNIEVRKDINNKDRIIKSEYF